MFDQLRNGRHHSDPRNSSAYRALMDVLQIADVSRQTRVAAIGSAWYGTMPFHTLQVSA